MVRHWESAVNLKSVFPGDLVVVDLSDMGARVAVSDAGAWPAQVATVLISGDEPVHPTWLSFASRRDVTVVGKSGGQSGDPYGPVASAVVEATRELSAGELARRLLESYPGLAPAAQLVRAVCERPCAVRRPRDLGRDAGMNMGTVRTLARTVGFRRTEHLISVVREGLIEEIAGATGLPRMTCLRLAGVTDSSNHRRQLARARLGSQGAFSRALGAPGPTRS